VGQGRSFHRINSEVRTNDFAVVAVDAIVRFLDGRRVISLTVEAVGKLQNIPGAISNTIAAPLATLLDNVNDPPRNQDLIRIQRYSPIFHRRNLR
jgi:hypothetical protein